MSRSLNKAMLIGNLTRDPVTRFTPTNMAVCNFGIATNRSWTPTDGGEKRDEVDFHNVVAFGKLAEICNQYLHKGDKVYVEGRLQTSSWKNKDGQDRQTTELVMSDMVMLGGRGGSSQNMATEDVSQEAPSRPRRKAASKASAPAQEAPVADQVEGVEDVADEVDIPF